MAQANKIKPKKYINLKKYILCRKFGTICWKHCFPAPEIWCLSNSNGSLQKRNLRQCEIVFSEKILAPGIWRPAFSRDLFCLGVNSNGSKFELHEQNPHQYSESKIIFVTM